MDFQASRFRRRNQAKIMSETEEKELQKESIELLRGKTAVLKLSERDLKAVLEVFDSDIDSEEMTRRKKLLKGSLWNE